MPEPKRIPIFKDLKIENGFYTSKDFLPLVSQGSKPGMCGCKAPQLPKLKVYLKSSFLKAYFVSC